MPKQSNSEARIQQDCVKRLKNDHCLKHHNPRMLILSIPNEGRGANSAQLIQTGLYPGCGDLFVVKERFDGSNGITHRIAFFEIKTPEACAGPRKNGQSQSQIDFEDHCRQIGIPYFLVRSEDEFMRAFENL